MSREPGRSAASWRLCAFVPPHLPASANTAPACCALPPPAPQHPHRLHRAHRRERVLHLGLRRVLCGGRLPGGPSLRRGCRRPGGRRRRRAERGLRRGRPGLPAGHHRGGGRRGDGQGRGCGRVGRPCELLRGGQGGRGNVTHASGDLHAPWQPLPTFCPLVRCRATAPTSAAPPAGRPTAWPRRCAVWAWREAAAALCSVGAAALIRCAVLHNPSPCLPLCPIPLRPPSTR